MTGRTDQVVDRKSERSKTVTVLVLVDGDYREHGVFRPGEHATSLGLPGFSVDVREAFQR